MAAFWVAVAAIFAAVGSGFAMDKTPPQVYEVPPGVGAHAAGPVTTRIIVKYIESESGRVENQEAAREAARALAEIAGVELRHVRLMSGNAQVVEVVGMTGLDSAQAQETIESVVRRIEADPAVEYAEPDSIMQIQHPVNDPRSSRWDLSMFLAGVMSQGADSSVFYRGAGMAAPGVVGAAALLYQIRSVLFKPKRNAHSWHL
jgi:serine protease